MKSTNESNKKKLTVHFKMIFPGLNIKLQEIKANINNYISFKHI